MSTRDRPLSPHLQIYRWQWTMTLSILHRLTGIALAVGMLMLVCWLGAICTGPESFAAIQGFLASWIGRILLFGWTWALFYHLCNGLRHLAWDAGWGFALGRAAATGYAVAATSVLLTLAFWAAGYAAIGAWQ